MTVVDEQLRPPKQRRLQVGDAVERRAVEERARRVDRDAGLGGSPATDRIVVFEREADGIHQPVTAGARRVGPMLGQPLAHRQRRSDRLRLVQRRDVRRRRRRRHAQDVVEDPLAADDRRRARRIGGDQQNAALAQQPAARRIRVERDAAEAAAVHVRDAVVLGQPLVDERVVRAQQVEHAPVLAHHAFNEQLRLLPERLPQVVVEVRKEPHVRRDRVEVAQVQPLRREVGHQIRATARRPASAAPAARARQAGRARPARRPRAARRPGCCSTGRTTGGTPARDR